METINKKAGAVLGVRTDKLLKVKSDNSAFEIKKGDLLRVYATYPYNGETHYIGVMNKKHIELPTVFFEELSAEEKEKIQLDFSIPVPSYSDLSDIDVLEAYRSVGYDKPVRPIPKDLAQEAVRRKLIATTTKTVHS